MLVFSTTKLFGDESDHSKNKTVKEINSSPTQDNFTLNTISSNIHIQKISQ